MKISEAFQKCGESIYLDRALKTGESYSYGLNKFKECLLDNHVNLEDEITLLSPDHFITALSWFSQQHYTKSTIMVYSAALKYFMNWLVIGNYLTFNYQQTLRWTLAIKSAMKRRESKLPRFPSLDQPESMRQAAMNNLYSSNAKTNSALQARDIALVEFLICTGCRNNEARSLTVGDIKLNEHQVVVTGKGNKQRVVFLSDNAIETLKRYWEIRKFANPKDPAFARHDNAIKDKREKITTTTVRNIVERIATEAGIEKGKFTPHYFRHAFAIKLLRETGNLALVQDLMGHASPKDTRVYAKIYPDELKEAHQRVFNK